MATLELYPTPTVSAFISAVATGAAPEIVLIGARGDGKTQGLLTAAVAHAKEHHARGFDLPVKWLCPTGTFESHKNKTHDSLRAAMWKGCWELRDQGHQGLFRLGGTTLVDLRLFGAGDPDGMNRLRAEAHCAWYEEVAAAEEIGARAITENHWGMGVSSLRLPSHANVAVSTQNYPDETDWSWQRWGQYGVEGVKGIRHENALIFRIPVGERATPEQRAKWAEAIKDPVMRRRLLEGKPGTIIPGRPVAEGFNEDLHVSRVPLKPMPNGKLFIGQDGGLRPASVIAQRRGGRIEYLAALASERAGIRQHFRNTLIPWLGEHAPWVLHKPELVRVRYDESMDTDSQADSETNPLRVMQELLPGEYLPGQNTPWSWRRDPLLAALAAMDAGVPLVAVDPSAKLLIRAWGGMWHYTVNYDGSVRKEEPKKPNAPWADVGDASAYVTADIAPLAVVVKAAPRKPLVYTKVLGALR